MTDYFGEQNDLVQRDSGNQNSNFDGEDPVGQMFKGLFNKEKFDELRRETTKNVAPLISDIAQKIEKESKIKLPEELTDKEKMYEKQEYFFSDENLNNIKEKTN